MTTSVQRILTVPFREFVEKVKQEFQKEGFGIIRVNADAPEKKNIGFEFRPFGMFFPCIVKINEQDDGATLVSVSTPEFIAEKASSTLQNFAVEVKGIVENLLDKL